MGVGGHLLNAPEDDITSVPVEQIGSVVRQYLSLVRPTTGQTRAMMKCVLVATPPLPADYAVKEVWFKLLLGTHAAGALRSIRQVMIDCKCLTDFVATETEHMLSRPYRLSNRVFSKWLDVVLAGSGIDSAHVQAIFEHAGGVAKRHEFAIRPYLDPSYVHVPTTGLDLSSPDSAMYVATLLEPAAVPDLHWDVLTEYVDRFGLQAYPIHNFPYEAQVQREFELAFTYSKHNQLEVDHVFIERAHDYLEMCGKSFLNLSLHSHVYPDDLDDITPQRYLAEKSEQATATKAVENALAAILATLEYTSDVVVTKQAEGLIRVNVIRDAELTALSADAVEKAAARAHAGRLARVRM
jgi:hypothetical protein